MLLTGHLEPRRIRRDNDGRSRGIGFVEFADAEIAHSAVRNLQGTEVGSRAIRIDYNPNNTSARGGDNAGNGAGRGDGGDAGAWSENPTKRARA